MSGPSSVSPRAPTREMYSSWRQGGAFLAVLLLASFNLRCAITSVPPVLTTIEHGLGLDGAAAGALTALPVVCMALFAPASARVVARLGSDRTILYSLLVLTIGTTIRVGGDHIVLLYGGTLLAGIGISAINSLLPGIVNARYGQRAGTVVGLYTMTMMIGATAAAALSVPASSALGGWPEGLAIWGAPGLFGLVAWQLSVLRRERLVREGAQGPTDPAAEKIAGTTPPGAALGAGTEVPVDPRLRANRSTRGRPLPWRNRTAWIISVYLALQSFVFYGLVSWLAPSYQALGWSAGRAGLLFSAFSGMQIFAAPLMPVLAQRKRDRRPFFWFSASLSLAGILALLLDPTGSPWVSTCVLGFGTGGLFPLGVTMLVDHVPDPAASARLSAMAFLVTYLVAAGGPTALGGLKDVTGGFHTGWLVLVAMEVGVFVIIGALTPERRQSAAGTARTTSVRETV